MCPTDKNAAPPYNENKVINVIKSENDDREYKYLILNNNMKILLISDPSTEKSAASLDVHIGFSSDPKEVAGIAHFCEHMLFLGTKKYPEEDEFSKFLSQNGGYTNAYTCPEFTNYHFDVKSEVLFAALDRFAQFFLSPLFDSNATDRELNAIDSEHQKNILIDSWRENYISKITAKPGHPFNTFGIGNLETLKTIPQEKGIDIRELLLDFHTKYYSSNIMSLVILGKESLEELQKNCVPLFENVNNKEVVVPTYEEYPYGSEELGVIIRIPTIMEIKRLELKFMIPDIQKHYKFKPWDYVTHLIGHEGEGSLLSLLKKKVWVNTLYAGPENGLQGFDFFSISMSLTDEGLNHIFEIIDVCFQYMNMLKNEGPQLWIYNEILMLNEMHFRFKNKQEAQYYVTSLSNSMHYYPPTDVLYGSYRMDSFETNLIAESLNYLNPTNFRCTVQAQIFEGKTDKVAKYYDAAYSLEKISQEQIQKWVNIGVHAELHLPKENLFMPSNLDVVVSRDVKDVKAVPLLLKDNEMMRVWYKADDSFFLPKSFLKIHVASPYASMTPSHVNHLSMYTRLMEDALVEFAYDAELSGISYTIDNEDCGFTIQICGYNSKQLVLLNKILEHVTNLDIKEDRFNVNKVELDEDLKNSDLQEPYKQIAGLKYYLMFEKEWSVEERLGSMIDLTVESLKHFIPVFLKSIYIECLMCGNLLEDNAKEVIGVLESSLIQQNKARAMLPSQLILAREYKLSKNSHYLFEKRSKVHTNSCVYIYLQVGLQEKRSNVLCELFCQMIEASFFDVLRTKEQLGYIVASGVSSSDSVQGIKAKIQTEKPPYIVDEKIDQFLGTFEETLNGMSDESFKDYVDGLAVIKLKKPKKLSEEAQTFWGEITSKQYHYHRSKVEVEELRKLTKSDVLGFYKTYISPSSKSRKKIVIAVLGKDAKSLVDENKTWQVIDDVLTFHAGLPLYPHVLPYNDVPLLSNVKYQ